MKNDTHYVAFQATLRYFIPALLIISALLPLQSVGQAINSCNLIPNPSFEQQNVSQPSGNPGNILARPFFNSFSQYDEVADWEAIGGYPNNPGNNQSYGQPTYYATNAPAGSATNPFTSPATNPGGSPFQPYNYNPSLHNGALSIIAAEVGTSSPYNRPQYVTPTAPLPLTPGATYYASFQAYHSAEPFQATFYLSMSLAQGNPSIGASTSIKSATRLTNSAWTRVAGKITIPAQASSNPWYVTIGNDPIGGANSKGRYYIDEVELYKISTAGTSTAVCIGTPITIGEGCDIPGATYAWTIGNAAPFATTLQTVVNPIVTTTYTLTVTLPDNEQLISSVTVTVNRPTAGPDQTICLGTSATLGQGCQPIGATYTWREDEMFRSIGSASQISVHPTYNTGYTLTVTLPNGTSFQSHVTVNVVDCSAISITAVAQNNNGTTPIQEEDEICRFRDVILTPGSTNVSLSSITWTVLNRTAPSDYTYSVDPNTKQLTIRSRIPAVSGSANFQVQVSGTSLAGTTITGTFSFNTTFRNSETGEICDDNGAGTDGRLSAKEKHALAYPNPATGTLTLPDGAEQGVLLNSQGRAVQQASGAIMDVRNLPAGLYNLRTVQNGKVVSQHIEVTH